MKTHQSLSAGRNFRNAIFTFLLFAVTYSLHAQFQFHTWTVGYNRTNMTIVNGMSRTELDQYNNAFLVDSIDSRYKGMNNILIRVEGLDLHKFVSARTELPIGKTLEQDSATVVSNRAELTMKFAFGFDIKDRVGIQFGLNAGLVNINQGRNLKIEGEEKWDYFIPSGGSPGGNQYFGGMGAWEIGLLVNTVVGINDDMGFRLTYSHNNLGLKKKSISGRNDQFEFVFYYAHPDLPNLGVTFGIQQNYMRFKGSGVDPDQGSFDRVYPSTRVNMTVMSLGLSLRLISEN